MSLVYLITALPRLAKDAPPPLPRTEFVRRARAALDGDARQELELLLLLDEVDETCRIVADAQRENPRVAAGELVVLTRTRRARPKDAPPLDTLPDWILSPLPQHVLLRRVYQHHYLVGGPFVREWARFAVDLEEVVTGLLARAEGMDKETFAAQMEGRFDSASEIIARHVDKPDLGLGRRFPWLPRVDRAIKLHDREACERELDALRWSEIESLAGTELFSVETVLAYYLKLRILERESAWDPARGQARLDAFLHRPDGLSEFEGALS